ncbi:MAG: HD domain-containing protein [Chloroflexi bacterium]|nr:HD domain-containing protein [Chloroflexota bacterium]
MSTTKQSRRFNVSATPHTLRAHISRWLGSAADRSSSVLPLSEAEQQALLRVTPDFVFRIELEQGGGVSVMGKGTRTYIAADAVAKPHDHAGKKNEPEDLMRSLCEELARQGDKLMGGFLQTGEVQVLELQLAHNGQTTYYEVRAAVCEIREVLVVVRDVTVLREAENAMARSRDELAHLNELLQNEASLRAEEEGILKKSFGSLEKLLEDTIGAIALIVQKKDAHTARHQKRVSSLACAIGREMGLKSSQVDVIGLAALLHDLGKVFIPADTLDKPGKLSEAEFSIVKNHAEADFQILKTIDLFCPIADIVHQHHERINGSGYPLGLKGDDILMEARVVAVADVVEAMVSDRTYRPALGVEAAMNEIAAGKGTLYDANAVDACIRLFGEGKFEFDKAETGLPPKAGA